MSSRSSAVAGFVVGSTVTVLGIWLGSKYLVKSEPLTKRTAGAFNAQISKKMRRELPQHIRDEQISRHTLYFGDEGMKTLRNASIVVVGVGGVGSHVAHMLGRAGVGRIRLIDFDQVTVSSLNRHACATLEDVGTPKVVCMKNFLEKICPDENYLVVEATAEMYTAENGKRLLERNDNQRWDIVIDAIDDVPTKAALLLHCLEDGIRALSCMGAGGKSDVTRLHVSDLRTAAKDPLATKLRQCLRKLAPPELQDTDPSTSYLECMEKLAIIYSSEKPVVKLADFTPEQQQKGVHNFGAVDKMRIRVLPVLGTMPAIMGQALASIALCELGGKPISPQTGEKVGKNVRNRIYQHLKRREDKLFREKKAALGLEEEENSNEGILLGGEWFSPVQIDLDDLSYLLEIWRNRCAVTGDRLGTVLELVRWDMAKPSCCNNLVLMGAPALKKFDQPGGKESIPANIRRIIEDRLASCNIYGYNG